MRITSLRWFLDSWPYNPKQNIRIARGADGRDIILVRQPMGLEEYEIDGRPDGRRVSGMESVFHFHDARITAKRQSNALSGIDLSAEDCAELFEEGVAYYHRLLVLFRLKDWTRVKRDATRIVHLMDFVKQYARCEEDRVQLDQWHRDILRINTVARAMILFEKSQCQEAFQIATGIIGSPHDLAKDVPYYEKLPEVLLENIRDSLANDPTLRIQEESLFLRQNDYWTVRYQGQTAFLKTSRGLDCLACLLRDPEREFHVSQLFASMMDAPALALQARKQRQWQDMDSAIGARGQRADPVLDAQAKAEYKRRLSELRQELHEAERFNDPERAAVTQEELDAIAQHLAQAVGLGGRDRQASSATERARSAVTQRIKKTIRKIDDAIPSLGRHLATRIKTGYFCSYNPHPERPVRWKF